MHQTPRTTSQPAWTASAHASPWDEEPEADLFDEQTTVVDIPLESTLEPGTGQWEEDDRPPSEEATVPLLGMVEDAVVFPACPEPARRGEPLAPVLPRLPPTEAREAPRPERSRAKAQPQPPQSRSQPPKVTAQPPQPRPQPPRPTAQPPRDPVSAPDPSRTPIAFNRSRLPGQPRLHPHVRWAAPAPRVISTSSEPSLAPEPTEPAGLGLRGLFAIVVVGAGLGVLAAGLALVALGAFQS